MSLLRGGRARWAALGAIVGALAAGGIAYAAIPDSGGVFHACYKKIGGQVRLVNSASDCNSSESATQWNRNGPTGPTGPSDAYDSGQLPQVLLDPAGFPRTVVSLPLPAGSFVVSARLDVSDAATIGGTEIVCELFNATSLEVIDKQDSMGAAGVPMPLLGTTALNNPGAVSIRCTVSGGVAPFANEPRIVAIKVGNLH